MDTTQAGMRVVDEHAARATYAAVGKLVSDEFGGMFDTQPAAQRLGTLTGREEGFYAWLAANYLAPSPAAALTPGALASAVGKATGGDEDGAIAHADQAVGLDGLVGVIDLGGEGSLFVFERVSEKHPPAFIVWNWSARREQRRSQTAVMN
jgi:hypothetical protein